MLTLLLLGCPSTEEPATDDDDSTPEPTPGEEFVWWCPDAVAVEARAQDILDQMNMEQKIRQMAGEEDSSGGAWPTPAIDELGVPGFRMVDGPRGVANYLGTATAFPVGMARGATWEPELEREVGRAMGLETRALGADVLLAPTVNILRHPRWGRAQETYGEDPLHVGLMGAAFIEGAQEVVVASVKHFAANSIENTRFTVDVEVSERALREVYLPAFERAVKDARVGTVMSAYNSVNGAYCSENAPLLNDVLRDEWGFPGVVESDWVFGMHDTLLALQAGLDIEMPFARVYGDPLRDIAWENEEQVDRALLRILRTQLCFGLDDPPGVDAAVVESAEHKALARSVAERSAVLLKNDSILPFEGAGVLAVVGPLADVENIGDTGSSSVSPSDIVTVLEGLQAAPGDWTLVGDEADLTAVDVAVVVVGLTADQEGESLLSYGDRTNLALPPEQVEAILAVAAVAPVTVVVLEGGSAVTVGGWIDEVDALVHVFYPGDQGGHAIADLLLGRAEFSGRLPFSVPVSEGDLPTFDNESDVVSYGLWHGHRHLLRSGIAARYPFGFGLSTSATDWGAPSVDLTDDEAAITVLVTNTGPRDVQEVVQLYAEPPLGALDRAPRELVGFHKTTAIPPGESRLVLIPVPLDRLRVWDGEWTVPSGEYRIVAARHVEDPGLGVSITMP